MEAKKNGIRKTADNNSYSAGLKKRNEAYVSALKKRNEAYVSALKKRDETYFAAMGIGELSNISDITAMIVNEELYGNLIDDRNYQSPPLSRVVR